MVSVLGALLPHRSDRERQHRGGYVSFTEPSGSARFFVGFRMPALTRAEVRAGGPASESLKWRKPRDGEGPAPRGRCGDLALGGAARDDRDSASADDARASYGPETGRSA